MTAEVTLTMSVARAQAVKSALELFSRLSIGQIESVTEMLRHGDIPRRGDSASPRALPTIDQIESIDALLMEAKSILGYSRGGSLGVGNPHVTEAGHLAWETYKELSRALAVHRNPAPSFRGVDYDGNLLRYTQEPLPVATVQEAAAQPRLTCPDQGTCHHRCVTPCARRDRLGCSPLSGSGLDERWQPIAVSDDGVMPSELERNMARPVKKVDGLSNGACRALIRLALQDRMNPKHDGYAWAGNHGAVLVRRGYAKRLGLDGEGMTCFVATAEGLELGLRLHRETMTNIANADAQS